MRVAILSVLAVVLAATVPATHAASARRSTPSRGRSTQGRFLVATEQLLDPNFARTVILILSHDEQGAMGVVVNRPSEIRLAEAVPALEELRKRDDRVFFGGPVALNLMIVLLRTGKQPPDSRRVFDDVYVTGSLKALRSALAQPSQSSRLRAFLGHAGWAPGQLEHEISRGDWRLADADPGLIFDTAPRDVWPRLNQRTGGEWTRQDPDPERPVALAAR